MPTCDKFVNVCNHKYFQLSIAFDFIPLFFLEHRDRIKANA